MHELSTQFSAARYVEVSPVVLLNMTTSLNETQNILRPASQRTPIEVLGNGAVVDRRDPVDMTASLYRSQIQLPTDLTVSSQFLNLCVGLLHRFAVLVVILLGFAEPDRGILEFDGWVR